MTFRVVLFVLLFAAVLGGTAGVVVWYNQAGFFVGIDHGEVTIFQGRPGGILWFKPAVVERTGISSSGLFALDLPYLRQGVTANSYEAARDFVHDILVQTGERDDDHDHDFDHHDAASGHDDHDRGRHTSVERDHDHRAGDHDHDHDHDVEREHDDDDGRPVHDHDDRRQLDDDDHPGEEVRLLQ